MNWKPHPVAEMFPMIPEGSREWNDLVESIENTGQVDPVVVDGNVLLDGRNRLRACEALGIKPKFVEWSTLGIRIDQDAWITAKNLDRRHLTPDQRAMIAASVGRWQAEQLAKANQEANKPKRGQKGFQKVEDNVRQDSPAHSTDRHATRNAVAERAGTSKHKAAQAIKVDKAVENGELPPEEREKVKRGEQTLTEAAGKVKPKPRRAKHPRNKKPVHERTIAAYQALLRKFDESEHEQVKNTLRGLL